MEIVDSGGIPRAVPSVQMLSVEFDGRRVGHLSVASTGERDEWEMHPSQDELLYVIEGAVDVVLRAALEDEDERILHVGQAEACIIPIGTWHRQVVVVAPFKMLFLTPETTHRPYSPEAGWDDRSG
jgi:mannose-6-phosphate isomerase-like protein (cupin superfamily)